MPEIKADADKPVDVQAVVDAAQPPADEDKANGTPADEKKSDVTDKLLSTDSKETESSPPTPAADGSEKTTTDKAIDAPGEGADAADPTTTSPTSPPTTTTGDESVHSGESTGATPIDDPTTSGASPTDAGGTGQPDKAADDVDPIKTATGSDAEPGLGLPDVPPSESKSDDKPAEGADDAGPIFSAGNADAEPVKPETPKTDSPEDGTLPPGGSSPSTTPQSPAAPSEDGNAAASPAKSETELKGDAGENTDTSPSAKTEPEPEDDRPKTFQPAWPEHFAPPLGLRNQVDFRCILLQQRIAANQVFAAVGLVMLLQAADKGEPISSADLDAWAVQYGVSDNLRPNLAEALRQANWLIKEGDDSFRINREPAIYAAP